MCPSCAASTRPMRSLDPACLRHRRRRRYSGDAGGGGAVLVRCVPAKRVGRVIVASWARLWTTFLGVPARLRGLRLG